MPGRKDRCAALGNGDSGVRIVTGTLKGRVIPFSQRRHADGRVTSSRLKESLFAMLGTDLDATSFLDLCAGTGQMAMEAASRGSHVVAAEPDRRRFELLKRLVSEWNVDAIELINAKAQTVIERLQETRWEFHGIFIDPPYDATSAGEPLCVVLLQHVTEANLCAADGVVAVQHSKRLEIPESCGRLQLQRQRRFGDSLLSLYELNPA